MFLSFLEPYFTPAFFDAKVATRYSLSMKDGSFVLGPPVYALCTNNLYMWENGMLLAADNGDYGEFVSYGDDYTIQRRPLELVFPLLIGQNWSAPTSQLLEVWNNSTNYATVWIAPPRDLETDSPSIGVVFAIFGNSSERYNASVTSCSVVSGWVPTQLYTGDGAHDSIFHSPTTDNVINSASNISYLASLKTITLDIAWAEIEMPATETLGFLTSKISDGSIYTYGEYFRKAVSMFVTNTLSGVGVNDTLVFAGDYWVGEIISGTVGYLGTVGYPGTAYTDAAKWTEFQLTITRSGYSYSTRGLTRRLAGGVLLVHILIATIYMVTAIWSG